MPVFDVHRKPEKSSLRDRRLKGEGKGVLRKGVLGARETRGACAVSRPNSLPFPFERLPRRLGKKLVLSAGGNSLISTVLGKILSCEL